VAGILFDLLAIRLSDGRFKKYMVALQLGLRGEENLIGEKATRKEEQ
jgi:hypothetical protein